MDSRALAEPSAQAPLHQKLKFMAFGVFHSMTDKTASKHPSSTSQWLHLAIILFDAVQALGLVLHHNFGWPDEVLSWMDHLAILNSVVPSNNGTLANLVFLLVVLCVWMSVFAAVHVGYSFRTNQFTTLVPLKMLTVFVSLLVTAGFIPSLGVLASPLSCSKMKTLHGDSFNCSGLHRVGFTVVAVATMIVFIPLGLAASLVFHHSDSNSPQITAMASGWYKFYATFTKAVMVLSLLLFAPSSPAVVALVICALQLGITAYVANTLPYFRLWMNRLVAALHGTLAYLALGSFVMSGGQSSQFADGWAAGGVLALLVGAWLPSVKYRLLLARLEKLHEPMAKYITNFHTRTTSPLLSPSNQTNAGDDMRSPEGAEQRSLRLTTSFVGAQVMQVEAPKQRNRTRKVHPRVGSIAKMKRHSRGARQRVQMRSKYAHRSSTASHSDNDVDLVPSLGKPRGTRPGSETKVLPSLSRSNSDGSAASDVPISGFECNGGFSVGSGPSVQDQHLAVSSSRVSRRRREAISAFAEAVNNAKHTDATDPFTAQATAQRMLLHSGRNAAEVGLFRKQLEALAQDESTDTSSQHRVGTSPRDVELLARLELERADSVAQPARRWWLRPMPKVQAVERAMWLYATAARQYTHTPTDIAEVKISFAAFVMAFTDDVSLAQQALDAAYASSPSLQGEFEVFSRIRVLQQLRHSQNIGTGQMNAVALVEFQKRFHDALRHHTAAVKAIYAVFSNVARKLNVQNTAGPNSSASARSLDDSADRIGHLVQKAVEQGRLANNEYKRLLSSHGSTAQLAVAYRMFVVDVLNNAALAAEYTRKARRAADVEGTQSVFGGDDVGSVASSVASKAREYMPRKRTHTVTRMNNMFRGGLLLFIVLVISMFVVTQVWVNDAASQLKLVHVSTELCTSSVATAVRARELYLDGTAVVAAIPRGVAAWEASMATLLQAGNDTLMDMQAFQTQLNTLFNADQPSQVSAAWTARSVKLRKLVASASPLAFVNETVNPYDAASTLLARAAAMARFQAEALATAPTLPSWRLVFDNAINSVLPALQEVTYLYRDSTSTHALEWLHIQIPIAVVSLLTLVFLGYGVFWRALHQVSSEDRGVVEVAALIPPLTVKRLVTRYRLALRKTRRLHASLVQAAEQDTVWLEDDDDNMPMAERVLRSRFAGSGDGVATDTVASTPMSSHSRGYRRRGRGKHKATRPQLGQEVGGGVILEDDSRDHSSLSGSRTPPAYPIESIQEEAGQPQSGENPSHVAVMVQPVSPLGDVGESKSAIKIDDDEDADYHRSEERLLARQSTLAMQQSSVPRGSANLPAMGGPAMTAAAIGALRMPAHHPSIPTGSTPSMCPYLRKSLRKLSMGGEVMAAAMTADGASQPHGVPMMMNDAAATLAASQMPPNHPPIAEGARISTCPVVGKTIRIMSASDIHGLVGGAGSSADSLASARMPPNHPAIPTGSTPSMCPGLKRSLDGVSSAAASATSTDASAATLATAHMPANHPAIPEGASLASCPFSKSIGSMKSASVANVVDTTATGEHATAATARVGTDAHNAIEWTASQCTLLRGISGVGFVDDASVADTQVKPTTTRAVGNHAAAAATDEEKAPPTLADLQATVVVTEDDESSSSDHEVVFEPPAKSEATIARRRQRRSAEGTTNERPSTAALITVGSAASGLVASRGRTSVYNMNVHHAAAAALPPGMLDTVPVRHVFNYQPAACCTINEGSYMVRVNEGMERLLGFTPEELLGKRVEMIMPQGFRSIHHRLVNSVLQGKSPQVIGKAGRQISAVHKDGTKIPVLLAIQRIEYHKKSFFVATMLDLRNHNARAQEEEHDVHEENVEVKNRYLGLKARVLAALVLVGLLQLTSLFIGHANLQSFVERSAEVSAAGRATTLSRLVAFDCLELLIGDGETGSLPYLMARLDERRAELSRLRFGLRYGDEALGLPGSARRYGPQDELQFGAATGAFGRRRLGTVELSETYQYTASFGLDQLLNAFDDTVAQLQQPYREWMEARSAGVAASDAAATAMRLGPNSTAIGLNDGLSFVLFADRGAPLYSMLSTSADLYLRESEESVDAATRVDIAVVIATLVVLVVLFAFVFRGMVSHLYQRARRTEDLLEMLPEEVAKHGALVRYYQRVGV